MKPFALSEKITRGSPRRAAKRRNANNVCSVDSDSTNSRCTARITPQVKSNTQNFLRGKSQQYRGPAWSKPVTANRKDWVTRRSGKGLIGCWKGEESWRLQCTHSLLTRFAKRRTPKIQKWFLREEIIADTPACFIRECWNLVNNRVKWDLGRIMGCFSSQDNWVNCSRPWTRKNPPSATKGLNLTRGEHLGILRPFLNASSSAEKAFSCSARIKHCLAAWSSSNDKSPFRLSVGEDFKFWMKRCTQATTRLWWKSPIVPAETQEEVAHTILMQHQRLHLTEKNDHQVTPSGPPSTKGLRPGIQDLATICPNSPVLQPKCPWWPDLPGCPPLDNETISPSKSTFGFHWYDWKWKFSNEKEHS